MGYYPITRLPSPLTPADTAVLKAACRRFCSEVPGDGDVELSVMMANGTIAVTDGKETRTYPLHELDGTAN